MGETEGESEDGILDGKGGERDVSLPRMRRIVDL